MDLDVAASVADSVEGRQYLKAVAKKAYHIICADHSLVLKAEEGIQVEAVC
jgi:hypothetical protein